MPKGLSPSRATPHEAPDLCVFLLVFLTECGKHPEATPPTPVRNEAGTGRGPRKTRKAKRRIKENPAQEEDCPGALRGDERTKANELEEKEGAGVTGKGQT